MIIDLIASLYESMDILMTPPIPEQYLNITQRDDEMNNDVLLNLMNKLDNSSSQTSNNNNNNYNKSKNNSTNHNNNNSIGDKSMKTTITTPLVKLQEAIASKLLMVLW